MGANPRAFRQDPPAWLAWLEQRTGWKPCTLWNKPSDCKFRIKGMVYFKKRCQVAGDRRYRLCALPSRAHGSADLDGLDPIDRVRAAAGRSRSTSHGSQWRSASRTSARLCRTELDVRTLIHIRVQRRPPGGRPCLSEPPHKGLGSAAADGRDAASDVRILRGAIAPTSAPRTAVCGALFALEAVRRSRILPMPMAAKYRPVGRSRL